MKYCIVSYNEKIVISKFELQTYEMYKRIRGVNIFICYKRRVPYEMQRKN